MNYDNGQSRVIARVPVITFNNPNGLQRQDGQSFTVSQESGGPLAETASTNGAGDLVTQSIEGSNVDIASEFTKLIVAQRAYIGQHQDRDHGRRHAAADDRHETLTKLG